MSNNDLNLKENKINKKSTAVNKFELRLWSKEHYGTTTKKYKTEYTGMITCGKSKERIMFHSAGQLLTAIEKLYKKAEKERRTKK